MNRYLPLPVKVTPAPPRTPASEGAEIFISLLHFFAAVLGDETTRPALLSEPFCKLTADLTEKKAEPHQATNGRPEWTVAGVTGDFGGGRRRVESLLLRHSVKNRFQRLINGEEEGEENGDVPQHPFSNLQGELSGPDEARR